MRVSLIGVGSGEQGLVSSRALQVFASCDELVIDPDVPESLWNGQLRSQARVTVLQPESDALGRSFMIDGARSGRHVARVRCGDGWRSVEALRDLRALADADVEVEVVPGVELETSRWREWLAQHPLYGRRVVITRLREQAKATAELLRSLGAEPWICPTIERVPPPDPRRLREAAATVEQWQVVAFTSANGVECFFEALHQVGKDSRSLASCCVAAIGSATAKALASQGIRADVVAKEFVGEAFAEAILNACPGARAVLIPRALEAREVLPDKLRAAGLQVDVVPAYETRGVLRSGLQPLVEAVGRGEVDAILLTSSSTVTHLVKAFGEDRALLSQTCLASIGPITTATAEELGLEVAVNAREYTVPALVAALEAYWDRLKRH